MNVSKTSKPFLFALIGITIIGIPLTLFALQQQQIIQQFAWSTQQSAITACSAEDNSADIQVSFANTESDKDIDVTANDLQTGTFVDLGTVRHQEIKTANIITGKSSLAAGSVLFKVSWTDGSAGTDTFSANYFAISNCSGSTPPTNFCPASGQNNEGLCQWDPLDGAQGYNVVVKEIDDGTTIQSVSVSKDATQSAFPMVPGKAYQCTISATNTCSTGTPVTSSAKVCPIPTVTPTQSITPTPPVCPTGTSKAGVCQWDALDGATGYNITVTDITTGQTTKTGTVQAPSTEFSFDDNSIDTYQCSVTAVNVCGNAPSTNSPPSTCTQPTPTTSVTPTTTVTPSSTPTTTPSPTATPSPTPTPTAVPTATPAPTATPTPTAKPTPTPTPVVVVRILTATPQPTLPPRTIVVQQPPQTQTVVQSGQNVVQQPPAQSQQTQQAYAPTTPVPTVMPTGNTTPTYILFGTSALLLLAGGLIFFIL